MAIVLNDTARSNRDFVRLWQFTDGDPNSATFGQLIDFTNAFIAIAVEDEAGCQKISATTTNGKVVIISTGVIQTTFSYSDMNLCAGSYPLGGYYQLNGQTIDLFLGELSIQRGIPRP